MAAKTHWLIFCQVIDNFGDIGVCWRLARQLRHELNINIDLWVDNLSQFKQMEPDINPEAMEQIIQGINIVNWQENTLIKYPHIWQQNLPETVIEAFACNIPTQILKIMRKAAKPPIWINLEYLSAEKWVEDCHQKKSPQNGLEKYFFFPGFTKNTGGLITEHNSSNLFVIFQRDMLINWLAKHLKVNDFAVANNATLVSFFAYDNLAMPTLLQHFIQSPHPIHLFLPISASKALMPKLLLLLNRSKLNIGESINCGALTITPIPFLSQDNYDILLAQMDINFVRGEDSFVRAQLASAPFIWQIYPQNNNAHEIKLQAFLHRYKDGLSVSADKAIQDIWDFWNGVTTNSSQNINSIWQNFVYHLPEYRIHGKRWINTQAKNGNLAANLAEFVQIKIKDAKI